MTRKAAAMTALLLVVGVTTTVQTQKMKLGEVLVFDVRGAKPAEAESGVVFQADRGSRKGQYAVAWTTAKALATGVHYQLLSPEKVGPLPEVDVLGMHYIKVRPDRREAFERFVRDTLHPAVANLRPDLRLLYYKAVNGPDAENYVAIFALTRESRDKYWPGGSDSDALRAAFSNDVRALAKELRTYLVEGSYAADDKLAAAVYESREWTDFVLVSADGR